MLINCAKDTKSTLCKFCKLAQTVITSLSSRLSSLLFPLTHNWLQLCWRFLPVERKEFFVPTVAKHLLRFLSSIDGCLACDIKCFQHTVVVNLHYINKTEENKIWDLQVKATPDCRRHFCRHKKFPVWSLCEKGWWSCLPQSVDLRCTTQMPCCPSQTLTNKSL